MSKIDRGTNYLKMEKIKKDFYGSFIEIAENEKAINDSSTHKNLIVVNLLSKKPRTIFLDMMDKELNKRNLY